MRSCLVYFRSLFLLLCLSFSVAPWQVKLNRLPIYEFNLCNNMQPNVKLHSTAGDIDLSRINAYPYHRLIDAKAYS